MQNAQHNALTRGKAKLITKKNLKCKKKRTCIFTQSVLASKNDHILVDCDLVLDDCDVPATRCAGALRLATHKISECCVPDHLKRSFSAPDCNVASALDTFHEHRIGSGAGATLPESMRDVQESCFTGRVTEAMQCLGSTMCCEAERFCHLAAFRTRLNALEKLHVELTFGWISQHCPDVVNCFAQGISPAMHLVSATSITETFVESDLASVVSITCALHHTGKLIVMKQGQKRMAMQSNTDELLWVMLRLASVLCKGGQLLCGGCWTFGVGALDDIRNVRIGQDVYGRVSTHANTIGKALQILMAKTICLEEAVDSRPGAMRKSFWRTHECPMAKFIGAIEAFQGVPSAPCDDAAVRILISGARFDAL
jgi:hypothetical protein